MTRPRSTISLRAIPSAIEKLKRRLAELNEGEPPTIGDDISGMAKRMANKINATLDEVFGQGTEDAADFEISSQSFVTISNDWGEKIAYFLRGRDRAIASVTDAIQRLEERLADGEEDGSQRALRAYEGLALHPQIAWAASDLYRDGHYANAVEASVKALNGLVRLRSGLELDGTSLMEKAFSPNTPILKFNDLANSSDRDEQKGFMMLFSGAVSGLRNPRAHSFIQDDPERALEFIAFVNLLAKLLDEAKRA
jgi:uncharacterized protein (TIGR02391 family)